MPRLSTFRGITVAVFWYDHPPPHFHASYGGRNIVVSIDSLQVTDGRLPGRIEHRILAWAQGHQAELSQAWHDVQRGQHPRRIAPDE